MECGWENREDGRKEGNAPDRMRGELLGFYFGKLPWIVMVLLV